MKKSFLLVRVLLYNLEWLLLSSFIKLVTADVAAESFENNSGVCGGPLEPCSKKHGFEISFKSGFLVGYVTFALVYTAAFMVYFKPWVHGRKRNKVIIRPTLMTMLIERRENKRKENVQVCRLQIVEPPLHQRTREISTFERLVTRMSFEEISKATENFRSDIFIGMGKMGTMYKAMLGKGTVAVKRLHLHHSRRLEKQFISELLALGRLRHRDLAPLLGFCLEMKEKILVYKYMSNGNLYDWLHYPDHDHDHDHEDGEANMVIMEWPVRVRIVVGVARGLAWLHHNKYFQIVHLNITSKCILLDRDFMPKISNFGGSIFMDPKDRIFSTWEFDFVKKDVYNFGVVPLELISRKEPSEMTSCTLVEWITHISCSSSGLYEVVDKSLLGHGFDGEISLFLRIACDCVQPSPNERPTMLQVYRKLRAVRERYGIT